MEPRILPPKEPLPMGNDFCSHISSGFVLDVLKSLVFQIAAPVVDDVGVSNQIALPKV